ncbi:MAG: TIGR01777 family oxidoreductase, partial [Sphingomonadales bacterium]
STLRDDMPTVLIAGGSGLIGSHLTRHFKDRGFRVYKLTRKPRKHGHIFWNPQAQELSTSKLHKIDVLINLAGENIGSSRWTAKRKADILASRVQSTQLLASMIPQMPNLKYYIGASGINCYENIPGKVFAEDEPYGSDYLALVVKEWEAAHQLVLKQVKGSIFRISMVLSRHGGSLHLMKQPVYFGLGAAVSTGQQYSPWIHIDDLCKLMLFAFDQKLEGTFNALGNNDTNLDMTKRLAKWLKRPLFLPNVPAFILKILLGERAILVLTDLRASNFKIKEAGFTFKYTSLDSAFKSFFK